MAVSQEKQPQLKRAMKSRHLFMISLGGIIGTGLFLGSGYAIGEAGPLGAILAYLVGGLLMYLAMVCLGELSVVCPFQGRSRHMQQSLLARQQVLSSAGFIG